MDRSRKKENKESNRNKVALANGYDETTISTDINRTQVTGAHKHKRTLSATHTKKPHKRCVFFSFGFFHFQLISLK